MAKIKLEYEVPNGDFCSHFCEDKYLTPPCKFLYQDKWCTIFGAKPSAHIEGQAWITMKLFRCKSATIEGTDIAEATPQDCLPDHPEEVQ